MLLAAGAFFKARLIERIKALKCLSMLAASALLLQGCGIPGSPEAFHKTAEAAYLQASLDRLAAQDYAALEASFDERVDRANVRQALQQMHALLPKGAPLGREPVQWNFQKKFNGEGERIANVAIQYAYPSSQWILVSATLSGEPDKLRLAGFHVQPLPASLADVNAFTLQGKSLVHYVFLLMAPVSLGIALFAFVVCLRTKGLKRKWLWALFTLMTVSSFTLNWTTGETDVQMLRVFLLGWGVTRFGWLAPWVVTVPIPLGALVFLWKHGRRAPRDTSALAA